VLRESFNFLFQGCCLLLCHIACRTGASHRNWRSQLFWYKYSRKFFFFFRFYICLFLSFYFIYIFTRFFINGFIYLFFPAFFSAILILFLPLPLSSAGSETVLENKHTYFYVKWNSVRIFDYWIGHDCSLLCKLFVKLVLEYVDEQWVMAAASDKWRRNAADIVALTRPLAEDKAVRYRILEKAFIVVWFHLICAYTRMLEVCRFCVSILEMPWSTGMAGGGVKLWTWGFECGVLRTVEGM